MKEPGIPLVDLLVMFMNISQAEARRCIAQGAVSMNEFRPFHADTRLSGGPWEIKCGKKCFTVSGRADEVDATILMEPSSDAIGVDNKRVGETKLLGI